MRHKYNTYRVTYKYVYTVFSLLIKKIAHTFLYIYEYIIVLYIYNIVFTMTKENFKLKHDRGKSEKINIGNCRAPARYRQRR